MRIAVIIGLLLAGAWQVRTEERSKQVVLLFDHRELLDGQDIDVVQVPKEATVVLGLFPMDKQTALPSRTIMLCRPYSEQVGVRMLDGKDRGPLGEIAFKCGSSRYLFVKLDIQYSWGR